MCVVMRSVRNAPRAQIRSAESRSMNPMTFSVGTLDATHSHGSIMQPAFGGKSRRQRPVSEVRDTPQHALTRTSETKGHLQHYDSSAAFRFEVPNRVCCRWCRSFKSAALAVHAPTDRIQQQLLIPRIAPDRLLVPERRVEHAPLAVRAGPGERPAIRSLVHTLPAPVH